MTHQALMQALLAERFGTPVREYKPAGRTAPIAELLDVIAHDQAASELSLVTEAS